MIIADDLKDKWEQLSSIGQPGLMEALSIRITRIDHGCIEASMPVSPAVKQPFGLLHGGASVALAETVSSLGSWMLIDTDHQKAVGLEINANHVRPVRTGSVYATATILHHGSKTHVWQTEIRNDDSELVCISRCTTAILSNH